MWITLKDSKGEGGDAGAEWEVEERPWVSPAEAGGTPEGEPAGSPQAVRPGAVAGGGARGAPIYASDFLPLWCGVAPPGERKLSFPQ